MRALRRILGLRGRTRLVLACALSVALPLAAEEAQEPAPAKPSLEGRRTGRRMFANFGRDLVGVVSKDSLKPFLITAGVTVVGATFDDDVHNYFVRERGASWLGDAGDQLGKPVVIVPMALALFGVGRLTHHQRLRNATYDVVEVTAVAATYTTVLKYATQRERPDGSNKLSFPSGHTANAFAWATIGAHYYGWGLGVPGYVVAGLVGISRMQRNVHYLSDVLAGAGLGYLSARSVMRKNSEALAAESARTTRLTFAPLSDPRGQGVGLRASLAF